MLARRKVNGMREVLGSDRAITKIERYEQQSGKVQVTGSSITKNIYATGK